MGYKIFVYNYYLENVTYLNSPTTITEECFFQCRSLTSFNIPPSVKQLEDKCFSECSNLQTVYIPKSVVSFGSGVFVSCHPELTLIFDNDSTLTFQNESVFEDQMKILKFYLGNGPTAFVPSSVETIEIAAFENKQIKTIEFENVNNILSIGDSAFSGSSLETITLSNKLTSIRPYTFSNAKSLTTIKIPSSIQEICEYSFYECNSLETITFEGSSESISNRHRLFSTSELTSIGKFAFSGCTQLKDFELPSSVLHINESSFSYYPETTFRLPKDLSYLGPNAFSHSNIQEFQIEGIETLTTLLSYSFSNLPELLTLTIPDSVETIETDSIRNCSKLKTVTLGAHVTKINDKAFNNLESLENVSLIDTNVQTLTSFSFYECPKLYLIIVDDNSNFIFEEGILFNKYKTELILYLKSYNLVHITIPRNVSIISQYAFSECSSIQTVSFETESSINDIKLGAFQNCKSLKQINFPSSLQTIGISIPKL